MKKTFDQKWYNKKMTELKANLQLLSTMTPNTSEYRMLAIRTWWAAGYAAKAYVNMKYG